MRVLLLAFLLIGFQAISQESSTTYFAQCLFEIPNDSDRIELENQIKEIPFTKIVRLDQHSSRAFIIVDGLENFSEEDLRTWFGDYGQSITCIQIGVRGVDPINPYPFTNCDN